MSIAVKPALPQSMTQDANSSLAMSDCLTNALRQLKALASCDPQQRAAEIIHQHDLQQEEIKELREQEKNQTIAMKVLTSTIEEDKQKQRNADALIKSLQNEIADKKKALLECSQKLDAAVNDAKKLKSEKSLEAAKVLGLSADITSLQKTMKDKDTSINQMMASESSFNDRLTSEQKRSGELKQECESLRAAMKDSQVKLERLETFRGPYQEMDEKAMIKQFVSLYSFASEAVSKILKQDTLSNRNSLEAFRKGSAQMMPYAVPLPASNSKAAQGMQLVIILAILLREIDKYIFQPNYLDSEDNQLRSIFSELAKTEGEKEAFCRTMLLSIDATAQEESVNSRASRISRDMTHRLFGTLSDDKQNEIRQTLLEIVNKAIEAWKPFQRSRSKYEPDFEPERWDDSEWESFTLPEEKTGKPEPKTGFPTDNFLTIFPRISRVDKDARDPLTYIVQIRKSHPLWSEAEQEKSRSPSSPTTGRLPFTRPRRESISANTTGPNGKGSANGKTSPNGKSFLTKKAV